MSFTQEQEMEDSYEEFQKLKKEKYVKQFKTINKTANYIKPLSNT